MLKVGACQFQVTSNIKKNLEIMEKAIQSAASQGVSLLVFRNVPVRVIRPGIWSGLLLLILRNCPTFTEHFNVLHPN